MKISNYQDYIAIIFNYINKIKLIFNFKNFQNKIYLKMGFDCFMEVIGKCPLKEFIQITRDNWLKSHQEDSCFSKLRKDEFVSKAQEWTAISSNRNLFIKQIEDISFDNFKLRVGWYGNGTENEEDEDDKDEQNKDDKNDKNDENEDEEEEFQLMNYSTLIFCEIILLAIDQQNPDLSSYLVPVFNDLEDLSVKGNNIKITLLYESSYKGSEKLDIDYSKLNQEIIQIKKIYPSIHVYTRLGMS